MKKSNTYKIFVVAIVASYFIGLGNTFAQKKDEEGDDIRHTPEELFVTIETILEMAGANNLIVQEYRARTKLAQAEHSKAKEWWLPIVYGGVTTHMLKGAAMNGNGFIFTDVTRSNVWLGAGGVIELDVSKALFSTKATKKQIEAQKLLTKEEKNQVILKTIHTYYDMQAAYTKMLAISDLMINKAQSIVDQMEIQVAAGIRYKSELLIAQTKLNHLKIIQLDAKSEYLTKSMELANLLNLSAHTRVYCADEGMIMVKKTDDFNHGSGNELNATKIRPGYKSLEKEMDRLKIEKKGAISSIWIPTLRLNTNGSIFGANVTTVYPTALMNMGLMWKIPLGSVTMRGDIKKYNAQITLKSNSMKQFQNMAVQELNTARSQVKIATEQVKIADETLQLAGEAMAQSVQRQMHGTAQPFEVFQAQEYYLQSKIDYINSAATFNKAQFALKIALGNNF